MLSFMDAGVGKEEDIVRLASGVLDAGDASNAVLIAILLLIHSSKLALFNDAAVFDRLKDRIADRVLLLAWLPILCGLTSSTACVAGALRLFRKASRPLLNAGNTSLTSLSADPLDILPSPSTNWFLSGGVWILGKSALLPDNLGNDVAPGAVLA
jgi:hypothetical protein